MACYKEKHTLSLTHKGRYLLFEAGIYFSEGWPELAKPWYFSHVCMPLATNILTYGFVRWLFVFHASLILPWLTRRPPRYFLLSDIPRFSCVAIFFSACGQKHCFRMVTLIRLTAIRVNLSLTVGSTHPISSQHQFLQTANCFHLLYVFMCRTTEPPKVVIAVTHRVVHVNFLQYGRISPYLRIAWIAHGALRSVGWNRTESCKSQSLKGKVLFTYVKTLTISTRK